MIVKKLNPVIINLYFEGSLLMALIVEYLRIFKQAENYDMVRYIYLETEGDSSDHIR